MNSSKRILVVDDDLELRRSLVHILKLEEYDVCEAEDGLFAKSLIEQMNFDLIITDIRMPRMDGVELFKWNKLNKNIPTIMITGFTDIIETKEAYKLGVREFLAKPYSIEEIIRIIAEVLDGPL